MSASYSSRSRKKLENLLTKLYRMINVQTNQKSQELLSSSQIFDTVKHLKSIKSISLSNIHKCLISPKSDCTELLCSKCFKAVYSSKKNYQLISLCDYIIANICLLIFILNLVFVYKLDSLISV